MECKLFCIYFHINPLKNEVFYVGKGLEKRAYSKHGRNKHWRNMVNKYGYIIDIVENRLTEQEAFDREIFYIKRIGRRDKNKGTLVNMTDGGDGMAGYKHSVDSINKMKGRVLSNETKKKMSASKKGVQNKMKGIKRSKDICDKISASKKGRTHKGSPRKGMNYPKHRKKMSDEDRDRCNLSQVNRRIREKNN